MAIKKIEIKGYRSIKQMELTSDQLVALIGQNGSGKSNILSAMNYFYKNLMSEYNEDDVFDIHNPLRNEVCIRITYDLKEIKKKIYFNLKSERNEYEKYYQKIQAISKNDEIVLELTKRKERRTIWNQDYNIRQIISLLFPLYFVDSRQIELTDWENLWSLIGDLVKLRYEDSEKLLDQMKEIILGPETSVKNRLDRLGIILKENKVDVKKLQAKQLGEMIAEIIVGGQRFQYDERSLNGYSNGTNSYNYMILLMDILNLVKQYKLKEPIIILDEPEISLHHMLVDKLMGKIFAVSLNIQFFISTHSARCVKNLLEEEEKKIAIYHVILKEQYTEIKQIRNLSDEDLRERVIITEAYTNSCFAKMIINVEGETEIELLKNKYLRLVFPFLKEIEIVTGMSNKVIYNLTAPNKRNYQIPGLAVLDMDKVLQKEAHVNCFNFAELTDYPLWKETYFYGEKRKNTLQVRKRIIHMCNKCKFRYKLPFYSCEDGNFQILLELIAQYYENYKVFIWKNTVEGAVITNNNLYMFFAYARKNEIHDSVRPIIDNFWKRDQNQQLNYLRMIFSGKCDYLLTKKQLKVENDKIDEELLKTLSIIKKTSGWLSRWLEFYFLNLAGIVQEETDRFHKFHVWLDTGENRKLLLNDFKLNFTELYHLISKIEMTMG